MISFMVKFILVLILLGAVPFFMGNAICEILGMKKRIAELYFWGMVVWWAIFQLITVPAAFFKVSFSGVVVAVSVVMILIYLYGVYKKNFPSFQFKSYKTDDKIFICLTMVFICLFLCLALFSQHGDADDSRFVVNAVDICRTNKLFLTDPATGNEISLWKGELIKDLTAPWAVFIAFCATITTVHPTIMAHTVLLLILNIMAVCLWEMYAQEFFEDDTLHKCIFVILAILLNIYGSFSVYSAECFFVTRLWQGKAVVAAIGIPAMILLCLRIYRADKPGKYIIMLGLMDLSLCLMSGTGTIIGALLLGCFGIVYGVMKKNIKLMLKMWIFIIFNVIYYSIYFILRFVQR